MSCLLMRRNTLAAGKGRCFYAQEAQDEERKASAQAKLTAMQQDIQQKELEHEALQAKHLQAQVRDNCYTGKSSF